MELAALCARPVHRFFARELRLPEHEADDLTQGFLLRFMERDGALDPKERTSCRGFIKAACRAFWKNEIRRRNGGIEGLLTTLPADDTGVAVDERTTTIDRMIDAEWRRMIITEAMGLTEARLTAEGRSVEYAVLCESVIDDGRQRATRQDVARRLGLTVIDVQNARASARRALEEALWDVASRLSHDPDSELHGLGLPTRRSRGASRPPPTGK